MCSNEILYEYLIYKSEFTKREHPIFITSNKGNAATYVYKDRYGNQHFVWKSDLETIRSGHIYSFEDDVNKYRNMLMDYYKSKIEKIQAELVKNEKYLEVLQSSVLQG